MEEDLEKKIISHFREIEEALKREILSRGNKDDIVRIFFFFTEYKDRVPPAIDRLTNMAIFDNINKEFTSICYRVNGEYAFSKIDLKSNNK